jgi:hypothetical protein
MAMMPEAVSLLLRRVLYILTMYTVRSQLTPDGNVDGNDLAGREPLHSKERRKQRGQAAEEDQRTTP